MLLSTFPDFDDDSENHEVFSLLETPKRERRAVARRFEKNKDSDGAPFLRCGLCGKCGFSARMGLFAIVAIATLALLGSFHRAKQPSQRTSHLRFNVTTTFNSNTSAHLRVNFSTTFNNTATSKVTKLSNEADNHNQEITDNAWQELLKHFHVAMDKPVDESRIGWIPLVVSDSKVWLAPNHLERARKEPRFKIFTDMMHQALLLNTSDPVIRENMIIRSFPMVMNLNDVSRCGNSHFPRFSWCTVVDPHKCTTYALPSFNLYKDAPNTTIDYDIFHDNLELAYPWSFKKPKAVWRGSPTGTSLHGWATLPRAQLVNVSIHHLDLLDAAFVDTKQLKDTLPDEEIKLRNHSRIADRMKFNDYQQYRAIMDIDGNAWSDRFGNLLRMNSVVVKVNCASARWLGFFVPALPLLGFCPPRTITTGRYIPTTRITFTVN